MDLQSWSCLPVFQIRGYCREWVIIGNVAYRYWWSHTWCDVPWWRDSVGGHCRLLIWIRNNYWHLARSQNCNTIEEQLFGNSEAKTLALMSKNNNCTMSSESNL